MQNANARATQLKQDLKEKDTLGAVLTSFDERKLQYLNALKKQTEETGAHGPCPRLPFWVCRESDREVFRLFLQMFLPKYGHGYLGKSAAIQWVCIQTKISGTLDLTESSVNAKAEELRRRLRTVEKSIQDSQQRTVPQTDEEPTDMNI
jgi:predicted component of type VI protein secretion system